MVKEQVVDLVNSQGDGNEPNTARLEQIITKTRIQDIHRVDLQEALPVDRTKEIHPIGQQQADPE